VEALYLVCGARRPQLKRDPLGRSHEAPMKHSHVLLSVLAFGIILGCQPGVKVTRTHRTLIAAWSVPSPYGLYQDSLVTIRFDTTHAFRAMQGILDDTSEGASGLKQRYRPQLDSARAAIRTGAKAWALSDQYVFNHLLTTTAFWAVNRRTDERLPRLEIEDYEKHCGSMCGHGERRFRLPDGTTFLRLLLWIS